MLNTDWLMQMGHSSQDLVELGQRTVVEPMKKLAAEFPQIQVCCNLERKDIKLVGLFIWTKNMLFIPTLKEGRYWFKARKVIGRY